MSEKNTDANDDLLLSGLPDSVASEKDDDALVDEFMGGSEWRTEPASAAPKPGELEEAPQADSPEAGNLYQEEENDLDLADPDEEGYEEEPDEEVLDEEEGSPKKKGGFLKDHLLYILGGVVMLGYMGWQYQGVILEKLGMSTPAKPLPPAAPLIVPQADPLSPNRPLPAAPPGADSGPAAPKTGFSGKISAPPQPAAPQAPVAQKTPAVAFPAPSQPVLPSSSAGASDAAKPVGGSSGALPQKVKAPGVTGSVAGSAGAGAPAGNEDGRFDDMQAKLDAALARVAKLEKKVAQLEKGVSKSAHRSSAAGKKKSARPVSAKPAAKAGAKKTKPAKPSRKKAPSFTVLGTYMDSDGHWVAQMLIGSSVYEMRRGERSGGIRVSEVDARGVVVNGRRYP